MDNKGKESIFIARPPGRYPEKTLIDPFRIIKKIFPDFDIANHGLKDFLLSKGWELIIRDRGFGDELMFEETLRHNLPEKEK